MWEWNHLEGAASTYKNYPEESKTKAQTRQQLPEYNASTMYRSTTLQHWQTTLVRAHDDTTQCHSRIQLPKIKHSIHFRRFPLFTCLMESCLLASSTCTGREQCSMMVLIIGKVLSSVETLKQTRRSSHRAETTTVRTKIH